MRQTKRWPAVWLLLLCIGCTEASGTVTVILTRNAETAALPAANPPLSPAGQRRAERLAAMLARAGVDAIFVTETLRTRQTAQPLARQRGLTPVTIAAEESARLAAKLRERAGGTVLVAGHGDTLPGIIRLLGGPPVDIGENDYDNLFVLTIGNGPASCLHLRYDGSGAGGGGGPESMHPAADLRRQKEPKMELDFTRSGGFAGMATQVAGKVALEGAAGTVTSASGYSRRLSPEEASTLRTMAGAALRQPPGGGGPGELRDGYQYEVTLTTEDGKKRTIVTHGEEGVTGIFSWVRAECENIWKYRTGG